MRVSRKARAENTPSPPLFEKSLGYVCRSVSTAQTKLSRLILEKRGEGYHQVTVEEPPTEQLDFSSLEQGEARAASQIPQGSIRGRLERLLFATIRSPDFTIVKKLNTICERFND